ncbi:MAG: hypothetical protein P1P65_00640 [Treponema sp.]
MLFKEWEKISIEDEYGMIETRLSNGWTVKQRFDWYVDSDGLHVVYSGDEMEVIGAEGIDEYSDEELAVLAECAWDTYEIEREIEGTEAYEEAVENFRDSLDPYAYHGVSEKDFFGSM